MFFSLSFLGFHLRSCIFTMLSLDNIALPQILANLYLSINQSQIYILSSIFKFQAHGNYYQLLDIAT